MTLEGEGGDPSPAHLHLSSPLLLQLKPQGSTSCQALWGHLRENLCCQADPPKELSRTICNTSQAGGPQSHVTTNGVWGPMA